IDGDGNRVTMTYDSVTGDLLSVQTAAGLTTFAYYQTSGHSNGLVLSTRDADGGIISYAYDGNRHVTEVIRGWGTALASTSTMIYDAMGDLLSETDGQSTTAGYAHVSTTSFAYDGLGRMTEEIDAFGTAQQSATQYAYDNAGNLLSVTDG